MSDIECENLDLTVNGETIQTEISSEDTLLDVLRENLNLTGAKKACDNGECGSCIVLMNHKPTKACLIPAKRTQGKSITTIEGLAASVTGVEDGILHPLQRAFLERGATQCGFCIPGMIMRAVALLSVNNNPSRDDVVKSLSKNLCRCTGYTKIIEAVIYAGDLIRRNSAYEKPSEVKGKAVGISVPSLYTPDTVTGAAKYSADLSMEGMLHAKILRSTVHHARIIKIDTSEAEALPGVVAIVGPDDVPGTPYLPNCQPQVFVFPKDKIRFKGEGLLAVAAVSERIAKEALDKIRIELEELPSAIELVDAAGPDAERLFDFAENVSPASEVICGDTEKGFSEADVVVEGEYTVPVREHAAMEPEAALAYEDEAGKLVIKTPLYHAFVQGTESIANNLAIPQDDVRIVCPAMGGNFGTRGDTLIGVVAGLLTRKTGKPVKIVFSRAESILGSCKAPSVNVRYKTGATKDGRIVAIDVEVLHGAGSWAPHLIPQTTKGFELCYFETLPTLLSHITGPYQVPNVSARAYDVLTNGPRYVPLRGTNANYLPLAYESQLDLIAEALGMDPLEIRVRNAVRDGCKTHIGQEMHEHVVYDRVLGMLQPQYEKARERLEQRKAAAVSPWKPGIGIGGGWRNIGYVSTTVSAGCEIKMDGRLLVLAGTVEQGQGPTTQFAQIGADALGVPVGHMDVLLGDTSEAPYPVPTFSSITTVATGRAVQMAAEKLRALLVRAAAAVLAVDESEIDLADGYAMASGGEKATFKDLAAWLHEQGIERRCQADLKWNGEAPNILYGYNAGLIELDVNVDTGDVRLLNHVNVCDPGTIVNPLAVEGQADGGIAFGVGFALKERFHPDNPPTLEAYGLPTTKDVPTSVTRLFVTEPLERGPFGAKSMAEFPGISPIPAIINAIANATGARVRSIPATPQRVKEALHEAGH